MTFKEKKEQNEILLIYFIFYAQWNVSCCHKIAQIYFSMQKHQLLKKHFVIITEHTNHHNLFANYQHQKQGNTLQRMMIRFKAKKILTIFYLNLNYSSLRNIIIQFKSKMRFFSQLKSFIKGTDFFYSSQMLRFQEQLEYRTFTGGIISMAIIITTLVGFASMIIDTLNRETINSQINVIKKIDPTKSVLSTASDSNFMFALEAWPGNQQNRRFFDISLQYVNKRGGFDMTITTVPTQPCTREHWHFIPSLLQKFDKLYVENWICPPINYNFEIQGKYSSKLWAYYRFNIASCKNQTDPLIPCAPQQQINQFFSNYSSFFYATIFYSNPVINPNEKEYISYYLQQNDFLIFGDKIGSQLTMYMSDYIIRSDNSIWPFEDWNIEQGRIVENSAANHPYQVVQGGIYATLNIAKSSNQLIYTRKVQKLSSIFSFIGGMVGAISAALFFVKMYTSLSFQLEVALDLFHPEDKQKIQKEDLKINIFSFAKYQIYKMLGKLSCKPDWPATSYISDCQKQIIKQLNVKNLIRRVIFLQHSLTYLFEDFQISAISIKNPTSPESVGELRSKLQQQTPLIQEENTSQVKIYQINMNNQIKNLKQSKAIQNQSSNPLNKKKMELHVKIDDLNHIDIQNILEQNIRNQPPVLLQAEKSNQQIVKHQPISKKYKQLLSLYDDCQQGSQKSMKIWKSLPAELKSEIIVQWKERNAKEYF